MYAFFIGIDVNKDYLCMKGVCRGSDKSFMSITGNNQEGFEKLIGFIKKHCSDLSKVFIAIETVGFDHVALISYLRANEINYMVVNPIKMCK